MFYKSVTLENYLPFTHIGNKKVHIDFVNKVSAFLGTNGSGKSSLLRAMTPYSPVRTDYGPNGKIVKIVEHNGHIFELTSDFKNTTAPHSFKKDDVELNLSGTTETQKDLIEEHLGITPLIDKILIGDIRICSTSKAERRALFSATYPGDLSFVIDYHKKVCSQARACANQLKLLKSREASIRSSLIDENERIKLEKFCSGAEDLIDRIDKAQLLIEQQSENYKNGSAHYKENLHYDYVGWNKLDIRDEILCLGDDVIRGFRKSGVSRKLKQPFYYESIAVIGNKHLDTAETAKARIEKVTSQVEEIRDELNKFVQAREANQSLNEKNQLEERFAVCQKELEELLCKIDPNPIVIPNSDRLEIIELNIIPYIRAWTEGFHSQSKRIMPQEELSEIRVRFDHSNLTLTTEIRDTLSSIQIDLHATQERLAKLRSKPYPKDCVQVCPLRSAISDNISVQEKHLNDLIEHKKNVTDQANALQSYLNQYGPILDEQRELHQQLNSLVDQLRLYNLEGIAFADESPESCCNDHCYEILNRVVNACNTTRLLDRKQKLVNEMESIRSTLSTLSSTKQIQMSIDLIESTIRDREEKISQGIKELDDLEEQVKKETDIGQTIKKAADDFNHLEKRIQDAYTMLNQERVDLYVKFCEDIVLELAMAKRDLQEELFKVSKTLQDQQKYIDILNSEIIPTTTKVEHDKSVYDAVADGLSPTNGLPCIYLIRFINRLIARANELIRDVWLYGMELMYLDEEKDLDFSIQVLIRNSTTVKDISMCSMGQQAIINLAMTLAICIERGYLDNYPLKLDEVDSALTDDHRTRLVSLLNKLTERDVVKQMFLVNHFAIQSGMNNCDSICLATDGILVPAEYNLHAEIS